MRGRGIGGEHFDEERLVKCGCWWGGGGLRREEGGARPHTEQCWGCIRVRFTTSMFILCSPFDTLPFSPV